MLVGTSAKKLPSYSKAQCVAVRGLTAEEPDHLAYFGAIVEPGLYGVVELLDGVEKKNDIVKVRLDGDECIHSFARRPWHECRVMIPNWNKPKVDAAEMAALNDFCSRHDM